MTVVVIETDNFSLKYDNVLALGRALLSKGIDVKMWDKNATCALDMVYKLKPDMIFYNTGINSRVKEILLTNNNHIRLIDTDTFEGMVVADTLAFKSMNPHSLFSNTEICLVQYPEIENIDNMIFRKRMSIKHSSPFRTFSISQIVGAKYCGWLPKEMHPILFSSANHVLALSVNTAINAYLCNKNVSIIKDDKEVPFSVSDEDIRQVSNETLAGVYIDSI